MQEGESCPVERGRQEGEGRGALGERKQDQEFLGSGLPVPGGQGDWVKEWI